MALELIHYQVLFILKKYLDDEDNPSKKASVSILKNIIECIDRTRNTINKTIDDYNTDMSIFVFMVECDPDISNTDKEIIKEFITSKYIDT